MHKSAMLLDRFGRIASDLRISVTDRCNLRCAYCIPPGAKDWLPPATFLRSPEIARLSGIAMDLGVRQIRLTGGEPLLRRDLAEIIALIKGEFLARNLPPQIALTTNAIGLKERLPELIAAGLERINLSLDSLNPDRFLSLTHRDRYQKAIAGIEAAAGSSLNPVKLNTVILNQASLAEIPELIEFCLARDIQWRAIEFMPIGPLAGKVQAPSAAEIQNKITESYQLEPFPTPAHAPARRWKATPKTSPACSEGNQRRKNSSGIVGIIASSSRPFCADCTRTRLSADGKIYSCLFSNKYTDLRAPLRAGASDQELAELWKLAAWNKPAGHQALGPVEKDYRMSKIGG